MSYTTVQSCTLAGIHALPVTVEIHISRGLPGMSIVGLPQSAVRGSKDRAAEQGETDVRRNIFIS